MDFLSIPFFLQTPLTRMTHLSMPFLFFIFFFHVVDTFSLPKEFSFFKKKIIKNKKEKKKLQIAYRQIHVSQPPSVTLSFSLTHKHALFRHHLITFNFQLIYNNIYIYIYCYHYLFPYICLEKTAHPK